MAITVISMQHTRGRPEPLLIRSGSVSISPLASPRDRFQDPNTPSSHPTGVAFVPFRAGTPSGISNDTRRAVRVQAAKASAAARKRTIARKLAGKRAVSYDDVGPPLTLERNRGRPLSTSNSARNLHALSSTPSPSPVRSTSAGQLEPFKLYPASRWNPQYPDLVDYFLQHFAHHSSQDLLGREAIGFQLWPEALQDSALFHAILLTAASHASASGAKIIPDSLLSQLRDAAFENINTAIAMVEGKAGVSDAVAGAIALLAAWELHYGSVHMYEMHMGGLETIVNLRGGDAGSQAGLQTFSPAVMHLILSAGHDLALYACKSPYFQDLQETPANNVPSIQLPGLDKLRKQRLILPSLLNLVGELASYNSHRHDAIARLQKLRQGFAEWSLSLCTKVAYCPTQTLHEDNIRQQASAMIRHAGITMCEYIYLQIVTGTASPDGLELYYDEAALLHPEALVGTLFEEVLFWTLFVICAATGRCEARYMRMLKRLQIELDLRYWSTVRDLLSRYMYPTTALSSRSYNLWEAIDNSKITKDTAPVVKEPTIFAKGVQCPPLYIGAAMGATDPEVT